MNDPPETTTSRHCAFHHAVNWLTILPLCGCAHKNSNILRRNKVCAKKRSRDILSKQVKMATFNGSEAAAGNDELYLAS
jgi:lipoprotein NlpI